MLNIWYQKETLKDTLVIVAISDKIDTKCISPKIYGDVTFKRKNLVGLSFENIASFDCINIEKFSKHLSLPDGLIYPTNEILEKIKWILIDIRKNIEDVKELIPDHDNKSQENPMWKPSWLIMSTVLSMIKYESEKRKSNSSVYPSSCNISKLTVGKIISFEPIANSHLNICRVQISKDANVPLLQIVCGANNVAKNALVVVATLYTALPDGTIIYPGKVMNVDSQGMLCSAKELALDEKDQKPGIIILDNRYEVGQTFKEAYANSKDIKE